MTQHTQLSEVDFKEAVQNTVTFKSIENKVFQNLYFKLKTFDRFYENYRQGVRYGIDYLRQKPTLQSRDVRIIAEILKT
jgi:hypothetical protein